MSVASAVARRLFTHARTPRKFDLDATQLAQLRKFWPLFVAAGDRVGVSPYLLAGMAWGESDFIPTAKNPSTGAAGLMQVMPMHFDRFGLFGTGWADPTKNINAGATVFAEQLRSRKSIEKALAGYGGFSSWLAGKPVTPGGPQDANWYIDEALGRAFVLELGNVAGRLQLTS